MRIIKGMKRRAMLLLSITLLAASEALACPVCYGDQESAEVEGTKWAILFLLGVTGTVLSGVVAFALHVRRRAKMTLNGDINMPSPN